jgi:hypothetical protein
MPKFFGYERLIGKTITDVELDWSPWGGEQLTFHLKGEEPFVLATDLLDRPEGPSSEFVVGPDEESE